MSDSEEILNNDIVLDDISETNDETNVNDEESASTDNNEISDNGFENDEEDNNEEDNSNTLENENGYISRRRREIRNNSLVISGRRINSNTRGLDLISRSLVSGNSNVPVSRLERYIRNAPPSNTSTSTQSMSSFGNISRMPSPIANSYRGNRSNSSEFIETSTQSQTHNVSHEPPNRLSMDIPSMADIHRTRRSSKSCNICNEEHSLMSKKHMTCYDCLVHFLSISKIFVQGFDITNKRDNQICLICLDTVKHIGSRYVICIDCLIQRIGDLNLLHFRETDDIHPMYIALDTSYEMSSVDWQRKKYFPCDICTRDNIEDTRTERICMDCLIDKLLDSPYFLKVKRRIYS